MQATRALRHRYPTRIHLLEIHDQPWCPAFLRDHIVDSLRCGWTLDFPWMPNALRGCAPVYQFVPMLRSVLEEPAVRDAIGAGAARDPSAVVDPATGLDQDGKPVLAVEPARIVDLASGMGGPMLEVARAMPEVNVQLSDLYPHAGAWKMLTQDIPNASYINRPVSAYEVGSDVKGLRTIMAAYHHFAPKEAESILRSAVRDRQPILVTELTNRSLLSMVTVSFMTMAVSMLCALNAVFTGDIKRALFTFVLPVIPYVLTIDGIVSCWRTYTVEELYALAAAADPNKEFDWRVDERPGAWPNVVPWFKMRSLLGVPRKP